MTKLSVNPLIEVHDDVLPSDLLKEMQDYLATSTWQFGALSCKVPETYRYWFRHFGGFNQPDIEDCSDEVAKDAPIIKTIWDHLVSGALHGHRLIRCYANGYPYGCEGVAHLDSSDPKDLTVLFYGNSTWDYNFAGETVFLTSEPPFDIIASVLPRPNRMVVFQGDVPHIARGISRLCPLLRITLMFKTKRIV